MKIYEDILKIHGANLDAKVSLYSASLGTPLHFVYGVSGCERVALKLVSLGADYTLRDNHDECYLDYLIKCNEIYYEDKE